MTDRHEAECDKVEAEFNGAFYPADPLASVLVPMEPTEAMRNAACEALGDQYVDDIACAVYRAMVKAASEAA